MIKLLLGEMSEMVLQSQKVIPERLLNEGFEFHYSNLTEALTDLIQTRK
jgi:NAD dependent epimerase/dehydratase family enzyme